MNAPAENVRQASNLSDIARRDFHYLLVLHFSCLKDWTEKYGRKIWSSILYRHLLCFSRQRRHYLEQVADDAVIGDLEDRRFGVFVDGHDGARAFHADDVLDRAGDADRQVELRRDGLSRRPDLAVHRQPFVVADRARGGQFGAERRGELLDDLGVLLFLDPAPHGDDQRRLRQVDGGLGLFEPLFGLLADEVGVEIGRQGLDRGLTGFAFITPERPDLEAGEMRRVAHWHDVGGEFALEDLAREYDPPALDLVADVIAEQHPLHRSRQLRREIARLISVRHQRQRGPRLLDHLPERARVAVGGVMFQPFALDGVDGLDLLRRDLGGDLADALPEDRRRSLLPGLRADQLRRPHGLVRRAIDTAVNVFDKN